MPRPYPNDPRRFDENARFRGDRELVLIAFGIGAAAGLGVRDCLDRWSVFFDVHVLPLGRSS